MYGAGNPWIADAWDFIKQTGRLSAADDGTDSVNSACFGTRRRCLPRRAMSSPGSSSTRLGQRPQTHAELLEGLADIFVSSAQQQQDDGHVAGLALMYFEDTYPEHRWLQHTKNRLIRSMVSNATRRPSGV